MARIYQLFGYRLFGYWLFGYQLFGYQLVGYQLGGASWQIDPKAATSSHFRIDAALSA